MNGKKADSNRYHDLDPQLSLCVSAQRYYKDNSLRTQVLPASLKSIQEVLKLAGVQHITIAAPLLEELASTSAKSNEAIPSLFDELGEASQQRPTTLKRFGDDEAGFRFALMRNLTGAPERKSNQACSVVLSGTSQRRAPS